MSAQRIAIWAIAGIALYFVIATPEQAAFAVRDVVGSLRTVAENLIFFLRGLAN